MNNIKGSDISPKRSNTLTFVIIAISLLFAFCLMSVILEPMFGKYISGTSGDPTDNSARVAKWAVSTEGLTAETIDVSETAPGQYTFSLKNTDANNTVNEVLTKFLITLDCSQISEEKKLPDNISISLLYKDASGTEVVATGSKSGDVYTFSPASGAAHVNDFTFPPGEIADAKAFTLKFSIGNTNQPYNLGEEFNNLIIKVHFEQSQ